MNGGVLRWGGGVRRAEEEVELRAWTVQAVERLKAVLAADHSIDRMSIQV